MVMAFILIATVCLMGGMAFSEKPDSKGAEFFTKKIQPILAENCFKCHSHEATKVKGGLLLDSQETALKGGETGPAIVPHEPDKSLLITAVSYTDPDLQMPPKNQRLTNEQVALLREWVKIGAPWGKAAVIATAQIISVAPRTPKIPDGAGNPIDRILTPYFKQHRIKPATPVSDAVFARRLYLDLIGLLPEPAQLEEFLADKSPDKRDRLAKRLLDDRIAYAEHWITFWQDHLRDGKQDLGSTDLFRSITPWLVQALESNLPYDQFVQALVNPQKLKTATEGKIPDQDDGEKADKDKPTADDPSGFLIGLRAGLEVARGDSAWEVQAAQNISQVFLAVPLKCATCHDSFVDSWKMTDSWGMAAIYRDSPIEMVRCELPTGKTAPPRFLFPEVGTIDPAAPVAERRAQLARFITAPQNGSFARTVVNRLWARLMGRGIVEPTDDLAQPAWNADLLDWLASDLVEHDYDLKRTLLLIVTSRAYQMPAVDLGAEKSDNYVFRGPALRRMTAEQFADAIYALLGHKQRVWRDNGGGVLGVLGRPDRRTIATRRDSKASTMQSLELVNGPAALTLFYGMATPSLSRPAKGDIRPPSSPRSTPPTRQLLEQLAVSPPRDLLARVSAHALSRPLTKREAAIYADVLGEKPTVDTVADLLWIISMLPEFQLIR